MLGRHISRQDKEGARLGGLQTEPGAAGFTEHGGRHDPVHLGGVGGAPHRPCAAERSL
jgi:hypothetical protein